MSKLKVLLLLIIVFGSIQASAQHQQTRRSPKKILPQTNRDNHVIRTIKKSNLQLVKGKNTAARPNNDAVAALASTVGWYNVASTGYEYEDSLRYFWHDTFGMNFDYIFSLELDIEPFKPYSLLSPKERIERDYISQKVDSMELYAWESTSATFNEAAELKLNNSIDANDLITNMLVTSLNGVDYENEYQSEYIYDSGNRLIEIIGANYNGTAFEVYGKDTFSYDANGNLIFEGWQTYDGSAYTLAYYIEYEYNTNDLLTKESYYNYDALNMVFNLSDEYEFSYDVFDNLSSVLNKYDNGGGLENSELYLYEYTGSNQILECIMLDWDDINSAWDSSTKFSYTYGTGINPETETIAEYSGTIWEENNLYHYYYNANDELDSFICEEEFGGFFFPTLLVKYNRNEFDQLEVLESFSEYNPLDSTWAVSNDDLLFTLYYEIDTTGINIKNPQLSLELNIFPNPATNQLTINTGNERVNAINIYDNMGRLVLQQRTNTTQKEITVSTGNLSNGTYTVQVVGDNKQGSKQVVIAR